MSSSIRIKNSMLTRVFNISNIVILIILASICILPFVHVVAVSFSNKLNVSAGFVTLWPKGFTIESYKYLLAKTAFWQAFKISAIRLVLGTAINLILIMLTAYPLSKESSRLKMRTFYAWFFFVTMLISGGLIPNFILINELGLRDSIWALVLPGALPIFSLVLMLNFFRQVPKELEEAAFIDGAGHLRTLAQVYIPISVPAIATISLFCMVAHWNAWFDGMIYMNSADKLPLQTYLRSVIIEMNVSEMGGDDWELLKTLSDRSLRSAQIIIAMIPILSVYPFLQKYFVKGIVVGSVKG
ncbi:carbohydrate ABC transporter permease [Paenibacillus nasutitermitis]|uniref:ABC transporter permease protein YtcP n=1 Tax=Paenibacillus nasutitermitis TaxID=1652958 RepID=A0A916ZKD3_9BACL|nr:carbohydrate ABC transporter permease [Paenibacillus nasutitermitis]GGE02143.1 putative ABC transporter permease protein YtcP [Paenibacillus nasutitermitis]